MFSTLKEVFVSDLIPIIDSTYRTIHDREHRAHRPKQQMRREEIFVP
jgi:hypothetical protein